MEVTPKKVYRFTVTVRGITLLILASITFLFTDSEALAKGYLKTPIVLNASEVLPQEIIKGINYAISEEVVNDGLINTYKIKTGHGAMLAESTAELMNRIQEFKALELMQKVKCSEVFGDAVVSGVKALFEGVANLVTDPVDTSKDIVEGAGQFDEESRKQFVQKGWKVVEHADEVPFKK